MTNKSWFPGWGDRNRDVEHFRGFKTQVDTLFEDWFGRSMGGVLAPRVAVAEGEKAVTLAAEWRRRRRHGGRAPVVLGLHRLVRDLTGRRCHTSRLAAQCRH